MTTSSYVALSSFTMKNVQTAIRVNSPMVHVPTLGAGKASVGGEGSPSGSKDVPKCAVFHSGSVFKLTRLVHWPQSAPSPELPALGSQNPRMPLDAAGSFDLPSKCLAAVVHSLNTTSGI